MIIRQAARWEQRVTRNFTAELRCRRPELVVLPQANSLRQTAAAVWLIKDEGTGLMFSYGCARLDDVTAEGLNVELPVCLRGRGIVADLRESVGASLKSVGIERLVFDAGQDGAVVWARRLPQIRWDRRSMTERLPAMIEDAAAVWSSPSDVEKLLAALCQVSGFAVGALTSSGLSELSERERERLVAGTRGPHWFVGVPSGDAVVRHRRFDVGLGEYVLTRREHWRGVIVL